MPCFSSRYHKNLILSSTIVQLAHRFFRVIHNACLRPQSYYTFLVYLSLKQVNQLKWTLGPTPPYSNECYYVCYMKRIICTHVISCSSCHYNIHYYMLLYMLELQEKTRN